METASAASLTASGSVGWAWTERAISSALAPNSMATASSAISALACGPTMCAPRIRSVAASARILTWPSYSPIAFARPLARNGKVPTTYAAPLALASSSVIPTEANSGHV